MYCTGLEINNAVVTNQSIAMDKSIHRTIYRTFPGLQNKMSRLSSSLGYFLCKSSFHCKKKFKTTDIRAHESHLLKMLLLKVYA